MPKKGGIPMGYRLDNKEVDLTGKRLAKIDSGTTGNVYRYKNSALKMFKPGRDNPLDEETARYLTGISTSRILLPRNLLFYNNAFRGYTYKLVSKKGVGKRMIMLPKDELLSNISILERDVEVLSAKSVLLDGIEPDNSIFNGYLYLVDPGKYTILDLIQTEDLEKLNKYQLHLLLTSIISLELRKNNIDAYYERKFKEIMDSKDELEDTSYFIQDVIDGNDSIKQFIKKMEM